MSCVTCTIVTPRRSRCVDPEHEVLEVGAGLRVDRGERLVHEQDLGLVGEGPRDRHALLHPAGELPRIACLPTPSQTDVAASDLGARGPRARAWRLRAPCSGNSDVPADASATGTASGCSPGRRARARAADETMRPARRSSTSPVGRRQQPAEHRSSVVLPQPDGPTIARSSPSATSNVTSAQRRGPPPSSASRSPRRARTGAATSSTAGSRGSTQTGSRSPVVPGENAALDEEEEPVEHVSEQAEEQDPRVERGKSNSDCWMRR